MLAGVLLFSLPGLAQEFAEPFLCEPIVVGSEDLAIVPHFYRIRADPQKTAAATIDLMVVYSSAAIRTGRPQSLDAHVGEVNRIYRDTGITFRVVGVYSMRENSELARAVAEAESSPSWTDTVSRGLPTGVLAPLASDAEIGRLRRRIGADIVMALGAQPDYTGFGIAYQPLMRSYFNARAGFAVVIAGSAGFAKMAIPHELGHVLGLFHQPSTVSGGTPYIPHAWAYESIHPTSQVPYITLMGAGIRPGTRKTRVPELSSDSLVTYKGEQWRIGDGNHRARDGAAHTGPWVANYHPTVIPFGDRDDPDGLLGDLREPGGDPDDSGPDEPEPEDPDPGGPVSTVPLPADLALEVTGEVRTARTVRYGVRVTNAGPGVARSVLTTSAFSGLASIEVTTSGCGEDPEGVPECGLGDIEAGDSASFTIDVRTGSAAEARLRYRGSVTGSAADPTPEDAETAVALSVGAPVAPTDLTATAVGSSQVELRWQDNSRIETGFDVFLQGPDDTALRRIASVPANTTATAVDELAPDTAWNFAVEAHSGRLRSGRSPAAQATTWYSDDARCNEEEVLCLGRFEVETAWTAPDGRTGRGTAHRLTAESGDFWFFDPASTEIVLKVLDGCRINGHYWVLAAGLTDVEVGTTVRDLETGRELTWTNPQGVRFQPIADRTAVACDDASGSAAANRMRPAGGQPEQVASRQQTGPVRARRQAAENGACAASDTALCLQGSRYEVRADWQAGEQSGAATAIPRSSDTGMFWFFNPNNVELVVKVLDGCALNGQRWTVMGGLTDVRVDITVTDTGTGRAKVYRNPAGSRFPTMFDVTAFPCTAEQQDRNSQPAPGSRHKAAP